MIKFYTQITARLLAAGLFCLFTISASAQTCNFDQQSHAGHDKVNETIYNYLVSANHASQSRITASCASNVNDTLRIPVIVHLVYKSNTPSNTKANLTDATVQSVIADWNLRYTQKSSRTYSNPYSGVETKIKFVLAKRDLQGNATTGILHHQDDALAFGTTQENDTILKKKYGWDASQYYNFYILDSCYSSNSGALAGYAYFPSVHGITKLDGAVFQGNYVWKSYYANTGLLAHETGHYLGLYHTFQGGCVNNNCMLDGDGVCDTPPKAAAGFSSGTCISPMNTCVTDTVDTNPRNPFRSKKIGGLGDQPDGLEFYMDYTGGCWGINYNTNVQSGAYSQGQMDRMRATLLTVRKSLLTSPALTPINTKEIALNTIVSPLGNACSSSVPITFNVSNFGSSTISSFQYVIAVNGVNSATKTWTGTLAINKSANVVSSNVTLAAGSNAITITLTLAGETYLLNNTICANIQLNPVISNTFVTNFETTTTGWSAQNPDGLVGFANYTSAICSANGSTVLGYLAQPTSVSSTGTNDYYVSDAIDLANFTTANFAFDYAHKSYYSNRQLGLSVEVSEDCGLSYTPLWTKTTSTGLATVYAGGVYTSYAPASCNDWTNALINLSAYLGKSIRLRFNANVVSYGAQNLFLDNLTLTGTKTVTDLTDVQNTVSEVSVYPNPFNNHLRVVSPANELVSVHIYDLSGRIVYENKVDTNVEFEVGNQLASGVYTVKITSATGTKVVKLLK